MGDEGLSDRNASSPGNPRVPPPARSKEKGGFLGGKGPEIGLATVMPRRFRAKASSGVLPLPLEHARNEAPVLPVDILRSQIVKGPEGDSASRGR